MVPRFTEGSIARSTKPLRMKPNVIMGLLGTILVHELVFYENTLSF